MIMNFAWIALATSLVTPPVVLSLVKLTGADPLSLMARALLWGIVLIAVWSFGQAGSGFQPAMTAIGLSDLTQHSALVGGLGALAVMLAGGAMMAIQAALKLPFGDRAQFNALAKRSFLQRLFIVLTAGVTEEILYRGVGLAAGFLVFGNNLIAALVSVLAFTFAHFRWSPGHLATVALTGSILTAQFYISGGDLWSCIITHLIVDGMGFLFAPAMMKMRKV